MPGKKKKYNARFPPARIKKIMQSDEEVGKVAAPVPVIISRALELFVQSILLKAGEVTLSRGARTLTPSHLKQCIINDQRYDFLNEHFSSVPDISAEGDSEAEVQTPVASIQFPSFLQKDNGPSSSATSAQYRSKPKAKSISNNTPVGQKRPRGRPRKVPLQPPKGYSDDIINLDSPEEAESSHELEDISSPISRDVGNSNKSFTPHFYLPKSDSHEEVVTPSVCAPAITFPKGIEVSIPGVKSSNKTLPKIPDLYSIHNGKSPITAKSVPVSVITSMQTLAKEKLKSNLCTEVDEDYDC